MALRTETAAPPEFAFAVGNWRVTHRRLRERLMGYADRVEFLGEMSTEPVMGVFGNVEDNLLYLPEGAYRAIALRSFDPKTGQWAIWLDARAPHQIDVPVVGSFQDGVGTFYADDSLDGRPIRIRFNWFTSNPNPPRREQAFSADGGVTWEINWTMDFRRAAQRP